MPIEKDVEIFSLTQSRTLSKIATIAFEKAAFPPITCPPCLAMLFFLGVIEETHNNNRPLATYHQKIPRLLNLVKEKHENIRLSGA